MSEETSCEQDWETAVCHSFVAILRTQMYGHARIIRYAAQHAQLLGVLHNHNVANVIAK